MQKSFKLVVVDVILELCQQTAEKVPNENHLGFQGAYNGEAATAKARDWRSAKGSNMGFNLALGRREKCSRQIPRTEGGTALEPS